MSTQYNQLIELGGDKKMIAASEVGAAPLPDQLQAYEAHWLWFAVWGDTFINNADWNSPENLKTVGSPYLRNTALLEDLKLTPLRSTRAITS